MRIWFELLQRFLSKENYRITSYYHFELKYSDMIIIIWVYKNFWNHFHYAFHIHCVELFNLLLFEYENFQIQRRLNRSIFRCYENFHSQSLFWNLIWFIFQHQRIIISNHVKRIILPIFAFSFYFYVLEKCLCISDLYVTKTFRQTHSSRRNFKYKTKGAKLPCDHLKCQHFGNQYGCRYSDKWPCQFLYV